MAKDMPVKQQRFQPFASNSQMLDPNRSIDQNHAMLLDRRLRIRRRRFSVPPRSARRRALSFAIRASNPKRTNEVFSLTPVNLAALFRRDSSMLSVVLICIMMPESCIQVKFERDNAIWLSRGEEKRAMTRAFSTSVLSRGLDVRLLERNM